MVIEHAAKGQQEANTGTTQSLGEAARITAHARSRLEAYLDLQDKHDALLRERQQRRQTALTADSYGDYVSRLLRSIRGELQARIKGGSCPDVTANAGTPHTLFTNGDWVAITNLYHAEKLARMEWELDITAASSTCPVATVLPYLTNLAWEFGQNCNPSLQGEQLACTIQAYAERCQRAHTNLEPLIKTEDWKGLRNMIRTAQAAIDTAFTIGAEHNARAALHYAVNVCYNRRGTVLSTTRITIHHAIAPAIQGLDLSTEIGVVDSAFAYADRMPSGL